MRFTRVLRRRTQVKCFLVKRKTLNQSTKKVKKEELGVGIEV